MTDNRHIDQLVVVGASAGGIGALSTLLETLPADFPAPIVIAQHLDPTRQSHLREILAQHGPLPVHTVTDHESLQDGVVFVVPANRHVEITNHEVHVRTDTLPSPKPSVDLLLRSAAQTFGERLVAVVLTGMGSDGADGAREVKKAGGTVVIQNPHTAAFSGMPASLAPSTVDIVADVEKMGPVLHDLLTGVPLPPAPTEDQKMRTFLEQVRERSGIDFTRYKAPTISRRLQRLMVAAGIETLDEYIHYLQRHPEGYRRLVAAFLIKVTEFFRDPEMFGYLREHVLPVLVAEAAQRGNELRFWSAGCATGEEAYSLAILLADILGDELDRFNVRIFATDVDQDVIAFARRGIYPASALEGLPADLVDRYFTQVDGSYEIRKRIRGLTIFGQHDLGQRAPFPRIDLALCRNVLIYFTTELQQRALQLFAASVRHGGFLGLGKAETTSPLPDFFTLEQPHFKIYRRHGDHAAIPPVQVRGTATLTLLQPPSHRSGSPSLNLEPPDAMQTRPARMTGDRIREILLNLPIGLVLVDRHYDIQTINRAARRLLGIHGSAIGDDIVHLTQTLPSLTLRAAIDRAFRDEMPASIEDVAMTDAALGEVHYLHIICYPFPRGPEERIDAVILLVADVTATVQARQALAQEASGLQEENDHLAARVQELTAANHELAEANQNLAAANLDLRGANDELAIRLEEAQSAMEEVETINEEMQATNEELETVNEELQATIEELNATNEELRARTAELLSHAAPQEAERRANNEERTRLEATLEALLSSIEDAALVVDAGGTPVRANAAYHRLIGDSALVPLDEQGQPLPPEATPQQRAARGETFTMEFLLPSQRGAARRRRFEARGRPIRVGDTVHGSLVVLRARGAK